MTILLCYFIVWSVSVVGTIVLNFKYKWYTTKDWNTEAHGLLVEPFIVIGIVMFWPLIGCIVLGSHVIPKLVSIILPKDK